MKYLCAVIFILAPCVFTANLSKDRYTQLQHLASLTAHHDEMGTFFTPDTRYKLKTNLEDLSLLVYSSSDVNGAEISFADASNIAELSSFNPKVKTVIYVHGWSEHVSGVPTLIRDALLEAGDRNVILVNWDQCATSLNYLTSWGCVEDTGHFLGQALESIRDSYGYSLDLVTLVGHSLGAHIAGYAGKYTKGTLGVIVGLDAAFPLFFKEHPENRLNATDAQFVHVVHTCTKLLGIGYSLGDADYWPNGGTFQVGCGLDIVGLCSHDRAFEYYAESVVRESFIGKQCGDFDSFTNGDCDENLSSHMGGLDIDTSVKGDFYLSTNEEAPFGQG